MLLLPFGLVGVGIAISVTWLVVGFVSVELARSVVGVSRRETAACLWPTTLSAAVAFAVVLPLERLVVRSDHYPVLPGLAWIVVECMLFALVYIGALRLISPSRYRSVRDVVGRALAKVTGFARRRVRSVMRVVMIGPYPLEPGVVNGGIESATSTLVPALAEREDIDSVTVSSATPATTPGSAAPPHRPRAPRRPLIPRRPIGVQSPTHRVTTHAHQPRDRLDRHPLRPPNDARARGR